MGPRGSAVCAQGGVGPWGPLSKHRKIRLEVFHEDGVVLVLFCVEEMTFILYSVLIFSPVPSHP